MSTPQVTIFSNMRVAGALILDKDSAGFPENAQLGTLLLKGGCLYGYMTIGGLKTWYPFSSKTASYVHSQGLESMEWTINHDLASTQIWHQIQDNEGNIISPMGVEIVSPHQVKLKFAEAIVGTVLLVAPSTMDIPEMKTQLITVGSDVRITDSGMTIAGKQVLTSVTMSIGDGQATRLTYKNGDRLNFVPGLGVELSFNDTTKSITINAPGASVTPQYVTDRIAPVVASVETKADKTAVTSSLATKADLSALDLKADLTVVNAGLAEKLSLTEVVAVAASNKVLRLDSNGKLPASITGNAATASSVDWANVKNVPAAVGTGSVETDFMMKGATVAGHILPTGHGSQDIGSSTNRFRAIYVDEAYLSTNTLYIGDTPVIGTSADVINIKADKGQSINVSTTGVGSTLITSSNEVQISSNGMNADVVVQATGAGSQVRMGATHSVQMTAPSVNIVGDLSSSGNASVGGSLTVTGNLTVNGAVTTVNSTTVTTKDNIMVLNQGQVGSGVSAGLAGLSIDRGDLPQFQMVFDESDDMFKVGQQGQLQVIASHNYVTANFAALNHSHAAATTVASGFMSAVDKSKLDGIAAGANVYTDAMTRAAISATGSLSYNQATGVIGFTTPTNGAGSGDFKAAGSVAMTGQFKAAAGTNSLPGVVFGTDSDSGLRGEADTIVVVTGGVDRLAVANDSVSASVPVVAPKFRVGSKVELSEINATLATVSPLSVAIFNTANNKAAKLSLSVFDVAGAVHAVEILVGFNGTAFYMEQYGVLTSAGELATFDVIMSGTNAMLVIAPTSESSKTFRGLVTVM
jgi:hypothetical protein